MFHLIWYIVVGLIAGVIAKSVMHVHMTLFWTIVLGIIGGIFGGSITHLFAPPTSERFHPAGLILSTLSAILILFVCIKLPDPFPARWIALGIGTEKPNCETARTNSANRCSGGCKGGDLGNTGRWPVVFGRSPNALLRNQDVRIVSHP